MSARGTSVNELLRIFDSSRQTICSWLDRWEAEGFEGLGDKQRPGAPTKLNEQEQKRALELLKQTPQSSNAVLAEHDLYYFDEAGFSLTPSVPYGWQPVGERYELPRPTTLVIDNAPIHTSARFQSMIPEWEKQDLYLWFLPPYCPELNLIEILWKKIKYYWLPIDAYDSFEKLDECLCQVLANIGKKHRISFQ